MKLRSQFPSTTLLYQLRDKKKKKEEEINGKVNETTMSNYIDLIHILTVIVRAHHRIFKRKEFHSFIKSQEQKFSAPEGEMCCLTFCFRLVCFCYFDNRLSY